MAEQGLGNPSTGSNNNLTIGDNIPTYILTPEIDDPNFRHLEFTKWLAALRSHLRVTQTTRLELKSKLIGTVQEAAEIYKCISNSQVIDLNLNCNNAFKGGMEDILQLLLTSKIKKFSFCWCMVSKTELLRLMEALKNTNVTELSIRGAQCSNCISYEGSCIPGFKFDSNEKEEFISHLQASHLTRFDFLLRDIIDSFSPLLRIAQNASVTNLDLSHTTFPKGVLGSLFSSLHQTAVLDLNLSNSGISENDLKQLSLNLRNSNVVNLYLAGNGISDAGLDILTEDLAHSKISTLDISENCITGSNSFGLCLKDTEISDLNLSGNHISSEILMLFPDSLRHSSITRLSMSRCGLSDSLGQKLIRCLKSSKVKHLNLSMNNIQLLSLTELAFILKDTVLHIVDISTNVLLDEGVILLGDGLKNSLLKVIKLNNEVFVGNNGLKPRTVALFLEKTKGTSLETVDLALKFPNPQAEGVKIIAASLMNTTLTHLNLNSNDINDSIVSLAPQLKFTTITRLDLRNNNLGDAGVESLANCLKDTIIMYLNLSSNDITDRGAKILAASLKGTKLLQLNLAWNRIENEGLEALAKHAEGTFLTVLDLLGKFGKRNLLDRILLENQTSVHLFVSFFKQIAPESNDERFHFDNIIDNKDPEIFLEKCFSFYKTVLEQASAVSAIVADESLSLSMEQSVTLLEEEFPSQLAAFITHRIEASPAQHVRLLKRAEELKLTRIVEPLLLNRPAFMIDPKKGILDPYICCRQTPIFRQT